MQQHNLSLVVLKSKRNYILPIHSTSQVIRIHLTSIKCMIFHSIVVQNIQFMCFSRTIYQSHKPVTDGIPICYIAFQAGHLTFRAWQRAVNYQSNYQLAMVHGRPPSLQSWCQMSLWICKKGFSASPGSHRRNVDMCGFWGVPEVSLETLKQIQIT